MNKKFVIIAIILLIIIIAAGYVAISNKQKPAATNNQTNMQNNGGTDMSGLKIETVTQGNGPEAKAGDLVTVNYTGTLENGTKFDSSLNPGRTPFQFTLGQNSVIKGWELGVLGMKVGEKRKLIIPSELGYGQYGAGGGLIPANATLLFEIDLIKIN